MSWLDDILTRAGFSGPSERMARAIALAESGGDPRAVNPSGAEGLFQIIPRWHPEADPVRLFDPLYNAREAYNISRGGQDWRQWETYTSGAYKEFYDEQGGPADPGSGGTAGAGSRPKGGTSTGMGGDVGLTLLKRFSRWAFALAAIAVLANTRLWPLAVAMVAVAFIVEGTGIGGTIGKVSSWLWS